MSGGFGAAAGGAEDSGAEAGGSEPGGSQAGGSEPGGSEGGSFVGGGSLGRAMRLRAAGDGSAAPRALPAGPFGVLLEFDSLEKVQRGFAFAEHWRASRPGVLVDVVPAERTLMAIATFDDAGQRGLRDFVAAVGKLDWAVVRDADRESALSETPAVELPVMYDGPDLEDVARLTGLATNEIVSLHTEAEFTVAFTGFAPGFAYLTGLPDALRVPRRDAPRTRVPAGAVALGGPYSGVYPRESPGGWQLIGRLASWAPPLWDETRDAPALLRPGTRVRFRDAAAAAAAEGRSGSDRGASSESSGALAGSVEPGLRVLRAGPLTTVQDLGRPGFAHLGVPRSGAADRASLKLANRLVGNEEGAPALEVTLGGAAVQLEVGRWVAVAGARCEVTVSVAEPARGAGLESARAAVAEPIREAASESVRPALAEPVHAAVPESARPALAEAVHAAVPESARPALAEPVHAAASESARPAMAEPAHAAGSESAGQAAPSARVGGSEPVRQAGSESARAVVSESAGQAASESARAAVSELARQSASASARATVSAPASEDAPELARAAVPEPARQNAPESARAAVAAVAEPGREAAGGPVSGHGGGGLVGGSDGAGGGSLLSPAPSHQQMIMSTVPGTAFYAPGGAVVEVGPALAGVRAYLAVAGGVGGAGVLGSRSVDLLSGIGGRALGAGERVAVGLPVGLPPDIPGLGMAPVRDVADPVVVRLVLGPRSEWFTDEAARALIAARWTVGVESNRTAVRLDGPALQRAREGEPASEPLVVGAVQVPRDGRPVLFLADHPVTGGYPVIACAHPADLDAVGQARPGTGIRFRMVGGSGWR